MSNDVQVDVQALEEVRGPAVVEKFVIRLPMGLRDQIRQLSENNRRSMNSEIIMVLENYIREQAMAQMAEASGDDRIQPETMRTESELERRLQNLPHDKKAALLQLLG